MAKPKFSLAAVQRKAEKRAERWADTGSRIAAEKHDNAPRAGKYLNKFGLRRSAPGDPPAEEEGTLLSLLRQGAEADGPDAYAFLVNYSVLEDGYQKNGRVLEPRPLGVLTMNELKRRSEPD